MNLFFAPEAGLSGDTFPFFHEGTWHLFHMCMPSIAHHVSRDLVHWERRPDAVDRGPAGSPDDGNNATGCVVEHGGSVCEIVIDERFFLSLRCYDHRDGALGVEYRDGPGSWSQLAWRPFDPPLRPALPG